MSYENAIPVWNEKQKIWRIRVMLNYKSYSFSSSIPGRKGKLACMKKYEAWLNSGVVENKISPLQAWENFVKKQETKNGAEAPSVLQLKKYGAAYIIPKLSEKKFISQFKIDDFQSIINSARATKTGAPLSHKTLVNLRSLINMFIKYCVAREYIPEMKEELYIPAGHLREEKKILSDSEIKALLSCNENSITYLNAFKLMLLAGLRPGEVYGLRWEDLDIENGVLHIRRSITDEGTIHEGGKTKNATRTIYLNEIIITLFVDQKFKTAHLNSNWIFCNAIGEHTSGRAAYSSWRKQLRPKLNFEKGHTPYSLRHTYTSLAASSGVPLLALKNFLGHSENFMTLDHYYHQKSNDPAMIEAAKLAELAFKNVLKNT